MRTLLEIKTRGDAMTMPGGIILRVRKDRLPFVVHYFTTDRYGKVGYHDGAYCTLLSDALAEVSRRVKRAESYETGGSLVPFKTTEDEQV